MVGPGFVERLRARLGSPQLEPSPASDGASDRERDPISQWFWDHYELAAAEVVDAFAAVGVSLTDKVIADIGSGDGIIDLGVAQRTSPARLVGYDVIQTSVEHLMQRAREEGVGSAGSERLSFERSDATRIPADDGAFELAFSWSAFEHVSHPVEVLREIRRILAPGGVFFLQLWPFYFSAKGSHLWEWFPEDHHHLQRAESEVAQELLASELKPEDWTNMMAREFQHLNRLTVDELQRSMLVSGFEVKRIELLTSPTLLRADLARYSWVDLAISGIKLLASPA